MKCLSHVLTAFNPMLRSSLIAACVALCAAVVCVPAVAAPEAVSYTHLTLPTILLV